MKKRTKNNNIILLALLVLALITGTVVFAPPSFSKYVIRRAYTINVTSVSSYPLTGVSISGTARVGQPLTAIVSPTGATATYRWFSGVSSAGPFSEIPAAVSGTYTPAAGDISKYLMVEATGTGNFSGTVTAVAGPVAPPLTPIAAINISGIQPVKNAAPIYSVIGANYTAAIVWSPALPSGNPRFLSNHQYTATITVTPNSGYSVTEASVSVAGATSVTTIVNTNGTITVTAVFPATQ